MDKEVGGMGEMIMLDENDYNELLNDVEYWHMTAARLSALLYENNIDHEVSEQALEIYIKNTVGELQ